MLLEEGGERKEGEEAGKGSLKLYVSSKETSIILVVFAGAGCSIGCTDLRPVRSLGEWRVGEGRGGEEWGMDVRYAKAYGKRIITWEGGLKGKKGKHD